MLVAFLEKSTALFHALPILMQLLIALSMQLGSIVFVTFFHVALIHRVGHIMQGNKTDFKESIRGCYAKFALIFKWALVSWSIDGLAISMNHVSVVIGYLATLGVVGWSFITFYVLPLIVANNASITQIISSSTDIAKKSIFSISGGIGWFGIMIIPFIIPFLIAIQTGSVLIFFHPTFSAALLGYLIVTPIFSAAYNIFRIKLYQLHAQEEAKEEFTPPV